MLPFPENPLLKPATPPSPTQEREASAKELEGFRLKMHFYQRELEALKIIIVKQQEQIMELELRLKYQSPNR